MNRSKPILRSSEEIREFVDLWKLSGKSKKEFTLEMGINYQTFIGWTKVRESKKTFPVKEKFIPLNLESGPRLFAELQFKSGDKLIFHQSVPAEYFQKILR